MKIEELNAAIADGSINNVIRVAEACQVKRLSQIADNICARDSVRLVLLAGASSAGKTTTAKRLCTQLEVNNRQAILLSTDDYFVGYKHYPRDEHGEIDYEHVDCVDTARFSSDMKALAEGRSIRRRHYDFQRQEGYELDETISLSDGGMVVVEGIHALNPMLTEDVDNYYKYGVVVRPRPTIEMEDGSRVRSSEARLLRRLVRDSNFRKVSPDVTIRMWGKVRAGEKRWITPFYPFADVKFDSYLCYELAVLKPYVNDLLSTIDLTKYNLPELARIKAMLSQVASIGDSKIPGDSILRETIGGSQLEY